MKILTDEQIDEICVTCGSSNGLYCTKSEGYCEKHLQAQAEMSYQRGREAQFVEMVEWMRDNEFIPCLMYAVNPYNWCDETWSWMLERDSQDQLLSKQLIGMALAVKAKLEE